MLSTAASILATMPASIEAGMLRRLIVLSSSLAGCGDYCKSLAAFRAVATGMSADGAEASSRRRPSMLMDSVQNPKWAAELDEVRAGVAR
jgi:hypothetical protein